MAQKKKFIKIDVPILKEEIMALGTQESLNNKTIKLDMSRKLRGRNLELTLLLKSTEDKIKAYPIKLKLTRQYITRMMRKRINYVEDSFQTNCRDIICTIKPFLITRKKVSRAVRQNLRKTTKEFLMEYAQKKNYLELCENVFYSEIQKELATKLKKIYPLSFCEIRILETKELDKAELNVASQERQEDSEETLDVQKEKQNPEETKENQEVAEDKPKKKTIKKTASKKEE